MEIKIKNFNEKKIFNITIILFSILFFIIVELFEIYSYNNEYKKANQTSKTLSYLIWNLDRVTSEDYLTIILQNNEYQSISVYIDENNLFLKLEDNEKINFLERILLKLNFIKIYPIRTPIVYNNQKIALLEIHWINKNISFYNYLLSIFVLISIILHFYLKIIIQKKSLTLVNKQLEIEIKQKENALEEIKKLKFQQDGDYYLTSLLLMPLSTNSGNCNEVYVEFLVKQRKKFNFKSWYGEIGGDICISHPIKLKDRKFVVCLNADCMGKSIQGAGGSLVLGSVFEAIIERTRLSSNMNQIFPERWLKNTFLELHKVFESFNGSMMASIFINLIDVENGLMYYMNAEHPYPVIYKNGKAEYFDKNFMFYKLGFNIDINKKTRRFLYVRTLNLKKNDIIIIGSDGRDDIILRKDNIQSLNTDENLFLEIVEQANCNLEKIYEILNLKGEIIDDISLLKIHYKYDCIFFKIEAIKKNIIEEKLLNININEIITLFDSFQPDEVKINNIYLLLRNNVLFNIQKSNFEKAINLAEQLYKIYPEKSELLFYLAYSYYKLKKYNIAKDYSEAYRLREPINKKNLKLLFKIYNEECQYTRANEILNIYKDYYGEIKSSN